MEKVKQSQEKSKGRCNVKISQRKIYKLTKNSKKKVTNNGKISVN